MSFYVYQFYIAKLFYVNGVLPAWACDVAGNSSKKNLLIPKFTTLPTLSCNIHFLYHFYHRKKGTSLFSSAYIDSKSTFL